MAAPDTVFSFVTAPLPDRVFSFRTRKADVVFSFTTSEVAPPAEGLSFVVNQQTGQVTLTYDPGSTVLNDPFTVRVTRLRDNADVDATATLEVSPTRLVALFDTEQDGVYHVRAFDVDGVLLFDVYLPVMPRGWRCWRALNHAVGTGGRLRDGGPTTPEWRQLLARLVGAEALVQVLDPATADTMILSFGRWCGADGQPLSDCSC